MEFGMSQLWFRITRYFATVASFFQIQHVSHHQVQTWNTPALPAPISASIKNEKFRFIRFGFLGGVESWHVAARFAKMAGSPASCFASSPSLLQRLGFFEDIDLEIWRHRPFWGGGKMLVCHFVGLFFWGGFWFALHLWYFDFMMMSGFL